MGNFLKLDEVVQAIAYAIDNKLGNLKEDSNRGQLSSEQYGYLIGTVLKIAEEWSPKLTYSQNAQLMDWFQYEYGINT